MSVSLHRVDLAKFADETFRFSQSSVVTYGNERGPSKLGDACGHGARSATAPDAQPMQFRSDVWPAAWGFWWALLHRCVWRPTRRWWSLLCWCRIRDQASQAHVHQRSGRSRSDWPRLRDTRLGSSSSQDHSERSGIESLLGRDTRSDQPTHAQIQGRKCLVNSHKREPRSAIDSNAWTGLMRILGTHVLAPNPLDKTF